MSRLWVRQLTGVLRLELGKTLYGRRALGLYLYASIPAGVCLLLVIAMNWFPDEFEMTDADAANAFAIAYYFILTFLVYLGCVWIFMSLFRGEVLGRNLHYYFLAPIRRELLVLGKFASGLITASVLFGGSTLICMVLLHGRSGVGQAVDYLLLGPGLQMWPRYLGATILACLGYGAIFLLVGLFFRNPIVPALLIFIWESTNPYLPALLKKLSVVFYLKSMLPIRLSEGPFALVADPVRAWLAVPGLILFSAVLLAISMAKVRNMEVVYGAD